MRTMENSGVLVHHGNKQESCFLDHKFSLSWNFTDEGTGDACVISVSEMNAFDLSGASCARDGRVSMCLADGSQKHSN